MAETDTNAWGITYSGVRNPVWAHPDQTMISCEVNWDHVPDETWSPCVVVGSGDRNYIHEIFNKCVAGDYGTIGDLVTPENLPVTFITVDGEQIQPAKDFLIRIERDKLLTETDYIMLQDNFSALTSEKQTEWTNYRAALRALPNNSKYDALEGVWSWDTNTYEPSISITWPTKPS